MNAASQTSTAEREIVLARTFDAPRELVFDAWTDPKQITQWGGTHGLYDHDRRDGGEAGRGSGAL
jgi:uncharacterized protein YndB with AHSA1/START domain